LGSPKTTGSSAGTIASFHKLKLEFFKNPPF
jgi:hypothetical protein